MAGERRILMNTLTLAGGEGVGQIANLLFVIAFARHYGPTQLGDYSFAMGVGAVAGLFVSLGVNSFLLRELASRRLDPRAAMSLLLPMQMMLVAISGILACTFVVLTSHDGAAAAVAVTVLTQIVYRLAALFYVPFRASEDMRTPVVSEIVYRIVSLGFAFALMASGASARITLLATLASVAAFALAGAIQFSRRFGAPSLRWAWPELRRLLDGARGYFGLLLIGTFGARFGPILLGLVATREVLGNYAVADRLQVAATLLPLMLANAAVPALSREAARSRDALVALNARLLRIAMLGGGAILVVVLLLAPFAVKAIFGVQFAAAVPSLRLLALAVPLSAVEQLLSAQVAAMGLVHRLVRVRAVVMGSYLVLGTLGAYYGEGPGLALAVACTAALQVLVIGRILREAGALPLRQAFSPRPATAPDRAG